MKLSILLAEQIICLFLIVLIGYIIVKSKLFNTFDSKIISKLVLYVVAPCTIINAFQIEFTQDKLNGLILAFVAGAIAQFLFIFITYILGKIFDLNSIEKASVIYSNSGNLVIPLVAAILGPESVLYTSGYIIVQTVLFWTHAKNMVSETKSIDIKSLLLNINIISIFIGIVLFLFKIKLPTIIQTPISNIGNMIGPLSMLVIGMILANIDLKNVFMIKRTYFICALRLIVYPVILIVIIKLLQLETLIPNGDNILLITILAACAPAAATITQFAQMYDKHPGYASAINVLSVIFCIVTMPLIVMLYQIL